MLKRLFCLISAFAVLFFVSVPVGATGMEIGGAGGAGIPIVGNINLDVVDLFDYMSTHGRNNLRWLANTAGHFVDEDICPNAPQLGGGHNFVPRRTLVDGQVGRYNVCEYCGRAYGDVCEEAYEQYVDTLPGTRYNSDGAFLWVPQPSDFRSGFVQVSCYAGGSSGSRTDLMRWNFSSSLDLVSSPYVYLGVPCNSFSLSRRTEAVSYSYSLQWPSLVAPLRGTYIACDGIYSSSFNAFLEQSSYISIQCSVFSPVFSGDFDYTFLWPRFWVTPYSFGSSGVGSSFSSDTRPSVDIDVSGDNSSLMLGYVENGNLVQSQSESAVFAEDSSIYVNPVTNNTETVTSWNYDYADRSYSLTTDEGDEITVTYGDANLIINEGDETYNVYYLVEHDDNVQCAHTYSSQITQSPTCTSGGLKTYTCSTCGHTYTQEIPASGHDYAANVTTAPTCSASGVRTFTCSVCGDMYTQDIPATGHDYVSSVTQEATCTVPGVRTSVCSVCGDTHTETIPATGHSYSLEITTAPTCTETGVRTFTCSVCGDVRTESVPATGHNYSSEVTMQPTCTTTGVRTFTCSFCGDSYTRSIPATGHRWRILQTVPSQYGADGQLTQAGYTLYQCETCNEQYRIDAASSGSELPMASSDGTSTGDVLSGEVVDTVDSHVGKGFLATIAHGLTEDLPEVLHSFSTWFVEFPQFYSSFTTFLKDGIFVCLPVECQRLIGFGFGMVTAVGIVRKIIGR